MKTKKYCLLLLVLMSFLASCSSTQNHNPVTGSELIGGSFSMTDHTGKKVTEKNFQGQYMLVFFGFTSCPSVCPMGLSTMGRVMHKLPKEMEKQIQPIFVTVDPSRDTGKKMKSFMKSFYPRFTGLRGTQKETEDMVFKYRGYYRKVFEDGEEEYLIDHSDIIYLMSKEGKYLGHFSSSNGVENIKNRIIKLLK